MNDYIFVTIGTVGIANTDIDQSVLKIQQHDKREKLVEILNRFDKKLGRKKLKMIQISFGSISTIAN